MDSNKRVVDFRVISLCFPDGQTFQASILPQHITLRDFIEETLSRLERERKVEIIFHEGLFSDSLNFKMIDSHTRSLVYLDMILESDPFILNSIQSNKRIGFDIEGEIFQTFNPPEIIDSSPVDSLEMPSIPSRNDSKVKFVLSKDEISVLAGIPTNAVASPLSPPGSPGSPIYPESITPPGLSNHIQSDSIGFASLIDAQKNIIDYGLVKLPLYQFESQSDSTSQLSLSSSGESIVSNSTSPLRSVCTSPDIPMMGFNSPSNTKKTLSETMLTTNKIFSKISQSIPIGANTSNYLITHKYLIHFFLNFRNENIVVYMESLGSQTVRELMDRLVETVSLNELTPNGEYFRHCESNNKFDLFHKIGDYFYKIIEYEDTVSSLQNSSLSQEDDKFIDIYLIQTSAFPNEDRRSELKIRFLISFNGNQLDLTKSNAARFARRILSRVKDQVTLERDPLHYAMPTNVNMDLSGLNKENTEFMIKIHKGSITKVLKTDIGVVSPDMLLEETFEKLCAHEETYKSFALRTFNKLEYFYGEKPFICFTTFRRLLISGQNSINLIVIPKQLKVGAIESLKDISQQRSKHPETAEISKISRSVAKNKHSELLQIPLSELNNLFRIRIMGIENIHTWPSCITSIFVRVSLVYGGAQLSNQITTSRVDILNTMRWNQWYNFDISVCNLPREARIHIKIFGCDGKEFSSQGIQSQTGIYPLHVVNFQVFSHEGILQTGLKKLNLWPSLELGSIEKNPDIYNSYGVRCGINLEEHGPTSENPESNKSALVIFKLDEYSQPVLTSNNSDDFIDESMVTELDPGCDVEEIEKIFAKEHLSPITSNEKRLILKYSYYCSQIPNALPKYLMCINWSNAESVHECHYLLKRWCSVTLEVALTLLDWKFPDQEIRRLAVNYLERLQNDELQLYLLQLVQVLKFEVFHVSPLATFLVDRALRCRIICHYFFWYLRSEIGTSEHQERYAVILEGFLRGCSSEILSSLTNQVKFITNTVDLYKKMWSEFEDINNIFKIKEYICSNIAKIQIEDKFCPIYDPLIEVEKLDEKLIKIMDSKKKPIWFEFKNNDSHSNLKHIKILVKIGDDLRQDMLTLQIFRLMDKLWLQNGLDLHMTIYGCLSTGFEEGIIEIVQNANTVCKIQREARVILEAFKKEVLLEWLQKKNPEEEQLRKAKENFLYSCAGYCVATYILGIGDRHNDNIMLTEDGNLFHIDFGHFLGNKKRKYGINREPVPFILTPDFIHVLGGDGSETYNKFIKLAIEAYQIIRANSTLFITLFRMMKSTGLPELREESDLAYLHKSLKQDLTEDEAAKHFLSLVQDSIKNSLQVQINWEFHIFNTTNVS